MVPTVLTAWVLVATIAGLWCHPVDAGGKNKPRFRREEEFVKLRFFLHDDLLVSNASAVFIVPPLAGIPKEFAGHSLFGGVVVMDDLITAGPEPDSLAVGRVKGFYVWDNNQEAVPGLEFIFTAVFNEASGFPGSTISYRGFNFLSSSVREISISGGTSKFRLARGWAQLSLASLDKFKAVLNITSSVFYGGY